MLKNLLADIPASLPEEIVQVLLQTPNVRIERIVSHGHSSPDGFWYDQPENEWVLLIAGAARLQFEDVVIDLKPGSFINIPAHRRHRVEWTDPLEPTIWLPCQSEAQTPNPLHRIADSLEVIASGVTRLANHFDPSPPDFVGTRYVAKKLGCTAVWITELIRSGQIPRTHVVSGTGNGKPWKFHRSRIDDWLKSR